MNNFHQVLKSVIAYHYDNTENEERILFDDHILLEFHLKNISVTDQEYFTFLLALLPHTQPHFLTQTIQEYMPQGGDFPEIGGVKLEHFRGIMPTLETLLFFLKPETPEDRQSIYQMFSTEHYFHQQNILHLEAMDSGAPYIAQRLILSEEILNKLLFQDQKMSLIQSGFPAKELTTNQNWSDLILNQETMEMINQIKLWIKHEKTIRENWGISKIVPKGFKALFHGASGTGKTLTASLLGKEFELPVYRIDLSQTISKYIGETEKNLERLFVKAQRNNCLLFFDEAEAITGKRSTTSSSQDRFANQQVSYLLQRIEEYQGVIILASNYKNNIDHAFLRRFNLIIPFKKPNIEERQLLWENMLPKTIELEEPDILSKIVNQYELTGSQIANVITFTALQTIENQNEKIQTKDLLNGIKLELQKEDKMFHPIQ